MKIPNILSRFRHMDENTRTVSVNMAQSLVIKGAGLVVSFLTTPAYMHFFPDSASLGVWFTAASLLEWILNFDLGIGNGLRNRLAASLAKGDREESKRLVSSAYFSVGLLAAVMTAILAVLVFTLDWNVILKVPAELIAADVLRRCVFIVTAGIMVRFLLQLVSSVLFAMQKTGLNNLIFLITSVIILVMIKILPTGGAEHAMTVMAWVHAAAYNLPFLAVTVFVFSGKLRDCVPRAKFITKEHSKSVLSLGGAFFVLQIAFMLIGATNEFLITRFYGAADVVDYKVYYKIFSLVSIVFSLALTPMWSMITKTYTEKNGAWLKKAYKALLLLGVLALFGETCVALLFNFINRVWLGEDAVTVNVYALVSFAVMGGVIIINIIFSTVANGIGALKVQGVCYAAGVLIKIPVIILLRKLGVGWYAVCLSNAAALIPYCIAEPIHVKRLFASL